MKKVKVYTIEITAASKKDWYYSRIGNTYDAVLDFKYYSDHRHTGCVVFRIDAIHHIFPVHCKIVSERIEEKN